MPIRLLIRTSIATAALVVATGCGGSTSTDNSAGDSTSASGASTSDGVDECGTGGAFPDDVDFRELLCEVQNAQIDVLASGGTMDPSWIGRQGAAVMLYGDDRDAAIADLQDLRDEMLAAAN